MRFKPFVFVFVLFSVSGWAHDNLKVFNLQTDGHKMKNRSWFFGLLYFHSIFVTSLMIIFVKRHNFFKVLNQV